MGALRPAGASKNAQCGGCGWAETRQGREGEAAGNRGWAQSEQGYRGRGESNRLPIPSWREGRAGTVSDAAQRHRRSGRQEPDSRSAAGPAACQRHGWPLARASIWQPLQQPRGLGTLKCPVDASSSKAATQPAPRIWRWVGNRTAACLRRLRTCACGRSLGRAGTCPRGLWGRGVERPGTYTLWGTGRMGKPRVTQSAPGRKAA